MSRSRHFYHITLSMPTSIYTKGGSEKKEQVGEGGGGHGIHNYIKVNPFNVAIFTP